MTRKTKLDKEKQFKRDQAIASEFLDEITQENEEKAASLIISSNLEAEKKADQDKADKLEQLERSRKFRRKDYIFKLAQTAKDMFQHIDMPPGWRYWIRYGEEKMDIIITHPDGRQFGRGIKPIGSSVYDLHAIGVLLTQCENTIDSIEERGAFRKDGIILPK